MVESPGVGVPDDGGRGPVDCPWRGGSCPGGVSVSGGRCGSPGRGGVSVRCSRCR